MPGSGRLIMYYSLRGQMLAQDHHALGLKRGGEKLGIYDRETGEKFNYSRDISQPKDVETCHKERCCASLHVERCSLSVYCWRVRSSSKKHTATDTTKIHPKNIYYPAKFSPGTNSAFVARRQYPLMISRQMGTERKQKKRKKTK